MGTTPLTPMKHALQNSMTTKMATFSRHAWRASPRAASFSASPIPFQTRACRPMQHSRQSGTPSVQRREKSHHAREAQPRPSRAGTTFRSGMGVISIRSRDWG